MLQYRSWLTQVGVATSHPLAFVVVALYVALWLILDRQSFGWQGAATVATWIMTLFIQRAEHRDTQAIHAKLDELLRAEGGADDDMATLDRQEPEEIEKRRDDALRSLTRPKRPPWH
jgi:low affinity Fe/Cu permease